jgi:hypothetical protein
LGQVVDGRGYQFAHWGSCLRVCPARCHVLRVAITLFERAENGEPSRIATTRE